MEAYEYALEGSVLEGLLEIEKRRGMIRRVFMELNKYIDHTNLKPTATREDIFELCMEAKEYAFASVCVNSYWVRYCSELLSEVMLQYVRLLVFR